LAEEQTGMTGMGGGVANRRGWWEKKKEFWMISPWPTSSRWKRAVNTEYTIVRRSSRRSDGIGQRRSRSGYYSIMARQRSGQIACWSRSGK